MSDSAKSENEDYHVETTGDIGDLELTIRIEGENEQLAGLIHAELTERADEIKQMVDHDIPPEGTQTKVDVDWESYLEKREEVSA